MPAIPQIVWILWLQGWDSAPEVPRICLNSWRRHNPGWEIRALCEADLKPLIDLKAIFPSWPNVAVEPEAVSDVIRLCLLKRHGGVWADSTLLCTRPLDEWLEDYSSSGFFAFERPTPARMVASWFLAAQPGHPVVNIWHEAVIDYWSARTQRDDYFWLHELFNQTYARNPAFRGLWDGVPKLSASGPHLFSPYQAGLCEPAGPEAKAAIDQANSPVFKLTHKYDDAKVSARSVLAYLRRLESQAQVVVNKPAIWASRRSVAVHLGRPESVTIYWRTRAGNPAVGVSVDGRDEDLFAAGPTGSQIARWIGAPHRYRFTLYADPARRHRLGSVIVNGVLQPTAALTDPIISLQAGQESIERLNA